MSDATNMYAKPHPSVDLSGRLRQCAAEVEWNLPLTVSALLTEAADALDTTHARVMHETQRRWRAEFYADQRWGLRREIERALGLDDTMDATGEGFELELKRIWELKQKAGE